MDDRGDAPITVGQAARLLGLSRRAMYDMVEDGALGTVRTYGVAFTGRARRRRSFELTRGDVDSFLERVRVKPGTLRHLYEVGPEGRDAAIETLARFCEDLVPPADRSRRRVELSTRSKHLTLWDRRFGPNGTATPGTRTRLAQVRYDPPSGAWTLYRPVGTVGWQARDKGSRDLSELLDLLRQELAPMFGD